MASFLAATKLAGPDHHSATLRPNTICHRMSLAVTHITGEGDLKASVEQVKWLVEVDLGLKRLEELEGLPH
jgi:hypothetical protein